MGCKNSPLFLIHEGCVVPDTACGTVHDTSAVRTIHTVAAIHTVFVIRTVRAVRTGSVGRTGRVAINIRIGNICVDGGINAGHSWDYSGSGRGFCRGCGSRCFGCVGRGSGILLAVSTTGAQRKCENKCKGDNAEFFHNEPPVFLLQS